MNISDKQESKERGIEFIHIKTYMIKVNMQFPGCHTLKIDFLLFSLSLTYYEFSFSFHPFSDMKFYHQQWDIMKLQLQLCPMFGLESIHVKMSSTRPHMSIQNVTMHRGLVAWASCKNGKKEPAVDNVVRPVLFSWHNNAALRRIWGHNKSIVNRYDLLIKYSLKWEGCMFQWLCVLIYIRVIIMILLS